MNKKACKNISKTTVAHFKVKGIIMFMVTKKSRKEVTYG